MRISPAKIVRTLRRNRSRIRATALLLGISPGTVILWQNRAIRYGWRQLRYLKRYSTRPHQIQGAVLNQADQARLQALRKRTGFGADKIKYLLRLSQHRSTIHRWFKQNGLVLVGVNHRRPRQQPTRHMHVKNALVPGKLQMDVKYVTPRLSGLPRTVYLYAILDIFSRYKVGVMLPTLDQRTAITAIKKLGPLLPFRADFIQTDNGREFQEEFHVFVTNLDWHHHYLHKSSPNENGAIERSFRTDEDEFFGFRMKRSKTLADLNIQYQKYLDEYNTERPHLSLNMMTPIEKLKSVQNV
jgi:transposase InsO family protein